MKKLTHIDGKGNAVMVDVRKKKNTHRIAVAKGSIKMQKDLKRKIKLEAKKQKKLDRERKEFDELEKLTRPEESDKQQDN